MPEEKYSVKERISAVAGLLLLAASACRPVITIGWGEMLLLVVVVGLILGPLLLRLLRGFGVRRERDAVEDQDRHPGD